MQSEQQYIDFFQTHRDTINHSCTQLLNDFREEAFSAFQKNGFPAYQSEEYQHTDVSSLLAADYGMNIKKLEIPANVSDVFCCDVPNLNTNLYYFINENYYKGKQTHTDLPAGVYCGSLNNFAEQYPDIFLKYYGKKALVNEDGLAAFNAMFVQDGFVFYVPQNTILEKPVQLVNILSGRVDTLVNRRILVIVEKGASAQLLICDHTDSEDYKMATTQVAEIFVGENASLDWYELEESTSNTIRLTSVYVSQQSSSNVIVNGITLMNGVTRNNYIVSLEGRHAESLLYGMAITDGESRIDNHTSIEHRVPECHSDELFKYVLDNKSVGAFSGKIVVDRDAQKTLAYQNNRNLCVSKECRMFAKPQLEIYADDVKCSHGLTTGQIDENALFYMRSRGINEDEARMLLKFAFTYDILDKVRIVGLRDRLKMLIEKRFRGELLKCRTCSLH